MTQHDYAGYVTHASTTLQVMVDGVRPEQLLTESTVSWECSCGATGATRWVGPPFNAEARVQWLQRIKADHTLHAVAEEEAG